MNNKFLVDKNTLKAFAVASTSASVVNCLGLANTPVLDNIKVRINTRAIGGSKPSKKNICCFKNRTIKFMLSQKPTRGLEPKISLKIVNFYRKYKIMKNFSLKKIMCTIWDDVRTYLTSLENNKEITALKAAINYFKEKEHGV